MTQSNTLNLTPFFAVWTVVFVAAGLLTGNHGLFWVAAFPWLLWFGLVFVLVLFGFGALGLVYLNGHPVKVTSRKGVRYVQRGRPTRWEVRNR